MSRKNKVYYGEEEGFFALVARRRIEDGYYPDESIKNIRLAAAVVANAVFGTWHLPCGLSLPDVEESPFTRKLHLTLLRFGGNKPLAYFRAALMEVFSRADVLEKTINNHAQYLQGGFKDIEDRSVSEVDPVSRFVLFPGSGIDIKRNARTGISDLRTVTAIPSITAKRQEQPLVYLYDAGPGRWFDRLRHAYLLNANPTYYSKEAQTFVEKYLLPKVCEDVADRRARNGRLLCSGRLTSPELASNLNVKWAGQSYGGTFCYMVCNALSDYMKDIGYTPDKIQKSLGNFSILSLSGALPLTDATKRPSPRLIGVEHVNDFVGYQSDRTKTHPLLDPVNAQAQCEISNRHTVFWLHDKWRSEQNPRGMQPLPASNSYGYHDIRAVAACMPEQAIGIFNLG